MIHGRRQAPPSRLKRGEWADVFAGRVQHRPDSVQVRRAHSSARGRIHQRETRLTQRGAVAIAPRGEKVVVVLERLALVEVDDPVDRVGVAILVRHDRIGRKREPVRQKQHVVRHAPGAVEVFLHERRRHRQRFPRVVETRLVGGIHRKLLRRPDVDARQVVNRVVVFGVAQPAREHDARVVRMAPRILRADRLDPIDDGLPLGRRRLLSRLAGRHLSGLEPREDEIPAPLVARDRFLRAIRRQIESGRRLVAAVAPIAIGLQEGLDARLKRIWPCRQHGTGQGLAGRSRNASAKREHHRTGHDGNDEWPCKQNHLWIHRYILTGAILSRSRRRRRRRLDYCGPPRRAGAGADLPWRVKKASKSLNSSGVSRLS